MRHDVSFAFWAFDLLASCQAYVLDRHSRPTAPEPASCPVTAASALFPTSFVNHVTLDEAEPLDA